MPFLTLLSLSFISGERLNYGGYYGPIRVGNSYIELKIDEKLQDKPAYKIECIQKTEGIFSFFFFINDYYCSYIDTNSYSSIRFIKKIHEGSYKNNLTLDFTEDSVYYSNGKKFDKIDGAKDIFASLYYMRTLELKSGDTLVIPFHSSGENQEMLVPISGPHTEEVPYGRFETYLLTPQVKKGKIFGSEKPIKIWVTTDSKHIPVKIQSKMKFGTISFLLESTEGGI